MCWTWPGPRWLGNISVAVRTTGLPGTLTGGMPPRLDGACDVVENPHLDARQAQPLWAAETVHLLHVRAVRAHHAEVEPAFNLWRIRGRKRIVHSASKPVLDVELGSDRFQVTLSMGLEHGSACGFTIPLDAHLRTRLPYYQEQARAIAGHASPPSSTRPVTRACLLHLRALQTLDAMQAGASQRDIAEALVGAEAVCRHWHADSELRAQVRHLISRAEGLMRGGYLALAGVRHKHERPHGDEPAH